MSAPTLTPTPTVLASSTVTPTPTSASGGVPPDLSSRYQNDLSQFGNLSGRVYQAANYGVKCDSVTDDTTAVQAAVQAANGGTLQFPAGTCLISSVVLDGLSVSIVGQGEGATTFKQEPCSTCQAMFFVDYGTTTPQTEFHNLSFNGNYPNVTDWSSSTVELRVDRFLADHVELYASRHNGIRLRTTTYASIIQNSFFHDVAQHGSQLNQDTRMIQVDHEVASNGDVWLIGSTLQMTNPVPASAQGGAGGFRSSDYNETRLLVWNNTFRNLGTDFPQEYLSAIDCYRDCDGSVIQGNQVYTSCYFMPIRVMRSNNVQVLNNVVSGCGVIGPDTDSGINAQGRSPDIPMQNLTVQGNTVQNLPGLAGIKGEFDADGEMSNVVVQGNAMSATDQGVALSYANGITITANAYTNVTTPLVNIVNNAGPVTLTNNTCTPVVAFGTAVDLSGGTLTDSGNCWDG